MISLCIGASAFFEQLYGVWALRQRGRQSRRPYPDGISAELLKCREFRTVRFRIRCIFLKSRQALRGLAARTPRRSLAFRASTFPPVPFGFVVARYRRCGREDRTDRRPVVLRTRLIHQMICRAPPA